MQVRKRDGRIVDFDKGKIVEAILKAMKSTGNINQRCANRIANEISKLNYLTIEVEEIQDIIENKLMASEAKEVAKAFILYRNERTRARGNTIDDTILGIIGGTDDYWMNENSNKNAQIASTQRDYMAGAVSTDLSRRGLLPADIVMAHDEGIIHFHDIDYFAQKIHNCFDRDTKLVTDIGVKPFKYFADGQTIKVVDLNGEWREAKVRKYGKQKMQDVTLSSGTTSIKVRCTKNHRWILKDGTVTENLKVNDRLWCLEKNKHEIKINDRLFCYGFILGDGTDYYSNHSTTIGSKVRLCGNKIKYSEYFERAGFKKSSQNFNDNDIEYSKTGYDFKHMFMNSKMWRVMPFEDIYSLFLGYYSADGYNDRNGLATSSEVMCEFIEECSSVCGYYIISKKEIIRDTPHKKNAKLLVYHFITNQNSNRNWIVKDINPCRHSFEAWCVEEPITHSFTLDGGIVTGNCCLVNLEDMLQNGTVINKTLIEKPHSFVTACNIATQIMAQIASGQYGGQTISLAHLAPFVQSSRVAIQNELENDFSNAFMEGSLYNQAEFDRMVERRVKKEIEKGVQVLQYQINTLNTSNGQTPFVSVNMYLNEARNKQEKQDLVLIIEEVLKQRIQGVKNEKGIWITPAFPKLLYVIEEDNCEGGTKYWWLTELAAKCTAKRMVPDFISEKIMLRDKINANGDGDVYPCMGCRSFLTPDRSGNGFDNVAKAKNYDGLPKYYGRLT